MMSNLLLCLTLAVRVTVYNDNLGLIKDTRPLEFKRGKQLIEFTDVAASIDPTSVSFNASGVEVLEQNYEYDLVNPRKLFQKYVDHKITLYMESGTIEEGNLLAFDDKNITLQTTNSVKIISREEIVHTSLPKLPEGLITRPTLTWWVNADRADEKDCEVTYLTDNINWHAEYTGIVQDSKMDFSGWVSVNNRSGATYKDAKLKLVAGKVHRVSARYPEYRVMAAKAEAAPRVEEREFFEYHIYEIKDLTTLKDKEEKQIRFVTPTTVKTRKIYIYDGARRGKNVEVKIEFENSKEAGLGIPLPEGKVRVYKEDVDGSLEFAGEDLIPHTPKDELVTLWLGDAFDLVGERKVLKERRIADRVRENEIEILLKNHKEETVKIKVLEHLRGDWEILEPSHPWERKDAHTIEFTVNVPKDGETKIKYLVRTSW